MMWYRKYIKRLALMYGIKPRLFETTEHLRKRTLDKAIRRCRDMKPCDGLDYSDDNICDKCSARDECEVTREKEFIGALGTFALMILLIIMVIMAIVVICITI